MSGLEKEFPGKVVGKNVDATTPESQKVVRALGWQSHGVVIRSPDGKVLWKQADHEVRMDDVRKALKNLLEAEK